MKMHNVASSSIDAIGYDEKEKTLAVTFTSGKTYNYADVPKDVFNEFLTADSVGKYFATNIRNNYSVIQQDV